MTPYKRAPKWLSRLLSVGGVLAVLTLLLFALIPTPASAAPVTTGFFSPSQLPAVTSAQDSSAVELGVKFTTSVSGQVTGVRFYKGAGNTGTHTGSLWSVSGTKLASATFASETTSGWQQVSFSSPVSITAGTNYVVSYRAPKGHYSYTTAGFAGTQRSGVLTVPGGTNGVYRYGAAGFPTASYSSTNYWVDVVFKYDSTAPSPSATAPAPSATPSPTVTVTATSPAPSPSVSATATPSGSASATPSVSATATAPVALCGTSEVWANLDACGWAGPATTGYPDGQVFAKTVSGGLNVTTSGAVIDGYKITGGVTVSATNVVIRNSMISNSAGGVNGSGVVKILNGASATVENNVLDGTGATHTCIWHEGKSMVARGNECRNVNDGIFSWASQVGVDGTGDNFTIEDNWLHSFVTTAANGHVDGYQTEGAINGLIRHNTFDVAQDQTSAIAIWNGRKSASGITVDGNLIQGGGFSVYAEDYSPSEASPAGGYSVTNIQFTNNVFSHARYSCVGSYGVWFTRGAPTDGWRRSGNRLLETGQNLDSSNPVVNGWECR